MGTSFTFLPIYEISIRQMMVDGDDGFTAYGRMLGTTMITALLELALSFLPRNVLKRMFPPLVCSITVMLIGLSLVGSGIKSWGGGVVCAEMIWKEHGMYANDCDKI
jgi:NCS2 family nucleobase:cation symporter-2